MNRRILFIGDGMSDRPFEALSRRTPLAAEDRPGLARLAGESGMVRVLPPGDRSGTVHAVPLILGWDPSELGGRAVIEAAAMGIFPKEGETAMRGNLCSLSPSGLMASHNAGGLTAEESRQALEALHSDEFFQQCLAKAGLSLRDGQGFRHFLIGSDYMKDLPGPHEILGRPIAPILENHPLASLIRRASEILSGLPLNRKRVLPVNALWFWGLARPRQPESFFSRTGLRGLCLSAVPSVRGIGRLLAMDTPLISGATGDLDTCWRAKIAALDRSEWDFALLHLEAPDERSHSLDLSGKLAALRIADAIAAQLIRRFPRAVILAMADHGTSAASGLHLDDPVPYALWRGQEGSGCRWHETAQLPLEMASLRQRFLADEPVSSENF